MCNSSHYFMETVDDTNLLGKMWNPIHVLLMVSHSSIPSLELRYY